MMLLTRKQLIIIGVLSLIVTAFIFVLMLKLNGGNCKTYQLNKLEFVQISSGGKDVLCYDKETKIVYIESAGYEMYSSRTPYLSASGNLYKYNIETKALEEIIKK